VGVDQLHIWIAVIGAQHDLDTGMAKELFIFIQTRTVVEIAEHDQGVTGVQMPLDPLAQPDALRQLLATVGDGNAHDLLRGLGAMS